MNIAILLSGGTGTRVGGGIPKQYIEVNGRPVISYCMEKLIACKDLDAIQIVADEAWEDYIENEIKLLEGQEKVIGFSEPGENRQMSIFNALTDLMQTAANDDLVFIHDAARPCLKVETISEYLFAAKGHDGVIPVLPMKDTVYLSENEKTVSSLLNRSQVFAGQAPETFVFGKYLKANEELVKSGQILLINGSTEPAILAGMDIAMVPGDEENFKITTPADLERFTELMK